jgi:hypothetical protein
MGFQPACSNVLQLTTGGTTFAHAPPSVEELPIVIRGSKGAVTERDPRALYDLACERGWGEMCGGPPQAVTMGPGAP